MSRRKEVTHCVPGGAGFRCLHCGEESNGGVAYPAPVNVWMAAVKTFIFDPRLPHVGFVRTDGMKGLADADADQLVALLRPCPGQKPAAAPAGGGE